MKSQKTSLLSLLLIILLLILPLSYAALGGGGGLVGGWTPIKDAKDDKHVKDIGEFAVNEHNADAKTSLVFKSVVSGQTQVVAGTNYKLIVSADDGKSTNNYEAIVWEKPWQNMKNLTSFKIVSSKA